VTAGANPISVKKGIDKTCEFLVAQLKEKAQPVKGASDIKARAAQPGPRGARRAAAARPGRRRRPPARGRARRWRVARGQKGAGLKRGMPLLSTCDSECPRAGGRPLREEKERKGGPRPAQNAATCDSWCPRAGGVPGTEGKEGKP
jgi:hypothetical protein